MSSSVLNKQMPRALASRNKVTEVLLVAGTCPGACSLSSGTPRSPHSQPRALYPHSPPTPLQSAVVGSIHIGDKSLGWREIWSSIPVSRGSLDAFRVPLCFVAKFQ